MSSRMLRRTRTMGANEFPEFSQPAPAPPKRIVHLQLPPAAPAPVVPTTDRTTAPAPVVAPLPDGLPSLVVPPATATVTCPDLWPWWWLLVAAGLGAGAGAWVGTDQKRAKKAVRRNAGRVVHRIVNAGARSVLGL
jgi:hypothetical protein